MSAKNSWTNNSLIHRSWPNNSWPNNSWSNNRRVYFSQHGTVGLVRVGQGDLLVRTQTHAGIKNIASLLRPGINVIDARKLVFRNKLVRFITEFKIVFLRQHVLALY